MKAKKLRGVAVGAGYFSRYQYEAWHRIEGVEMAAICNRSEDRARSMANEFGIPNTYAIDDFDKMLEVEKPDFVDIITPPETHLELVEVAARRGVAIICQKPLAPTMEESWAVVETAKQTGVRFMVHENWRWQPWYRKIRTCIDEGMLGEVFSVAVRSRMGDGWQEDAYLARQPFFRTYPRLLIFETGIHFLDTFRFLLGEPASVYARLQKRNAAIAGEDAGQVMLGFPGGATATWDASRYNESEAEDARYTFGTVRVDGAKGHIELDLEGNLRFKPLGQPVRSIAYEHTRRGFAGDCVHAVQQHFVECMFSGAEFESTGEDYLNSVRLVEACYQSHADGNVVHMEDVS